MIHYQLQKTFIYLLLIFIDLADGSIVHHNHPFTNSTESRRSIRGRRHEIRLRDKNDESVVLQRRILQSTTVKLVLHNTVIGQKIGDLTNGYVANLKALGLSKASDLTIEAVVTSDTNVGSIKFTLDLVGYQKIEGTAPYLLCGNAGITYFPCSPLTLGKHTIQAVPYSGGSGGGSVLGSGTDFTVNFEIIDGQSNPQPSPVTPPVNPPVSQPTTKCTVPKLIGSWEKWIPGYPISVMEGLGAIIGKDFVVVSGFSGNYQTVTKKVFAFDTTDPNAQWRERDEVPVPVGFSHAAFALVNDSIMYICGAYVGPTPGPHSDVCLKYEHNKSPGTQFSFLPKLPEGRGGGGMVYMKVTNSLLYATGATRPSGTAFDHSDVWELSLDNLSAGWLKRPDIPYKGNHVSHVTATLDGIQRHFFLGGQSGNGEANDNLDDNVEWDNINKNWIRRASMPFKRGHTSSSVFPYGCGFLVAGGAVQGYVRTSDISYYAVDKDQWFKVGDLPLAVNTPACDIVRLGAGNDWIYCQTGSTGKFSWKVRISL